MPAPAPVLLRPVETAEAPRPPEAEPAARGPAQQQSPADVPAKDEPNKGGAKKRAVIALVLLALLGAGGWYGWGWWTDGRFIVSTDDAYARADVVGIAAKVGGYVEAMPVDENQRVDAGELIARIDPGDYRLALDAAQAKVRTGEATVARLGAGLAVAQAAVAQAKADLDAALAEQTRASADDARYAKLVDQRVVATQRVEQAQADKARADSAVQSARARVTSAQAAIQVAVAQRDEAERQVGELRVAAARAARDLAFTQVRAPVAGTFGNKAAEVGSYMQPGARLGALVPLGALHVEANLKETDLDRVRVGQTASVRVDAAGGRSIPGRVVSVSPATGSTFSLLPPENATGNFTKIVQRVPVRVEVSPEDAASVGLRAGLSVIVGIDTRTGGEAGTR